MCKDPLNMLCVTKYHILLVACIEPCSFITCSENQRFPNFSGLGTLFSSLNIYRTNTFCGPPSIEYKSAHRDLSVT